MESAACAPAQGIEACRSWRGQRFVNFMVFSTVPNHVTCKHFQIERETSIYIHSKYGGSYIAADGAPYHGFLVFLTPVLPQHPPRAPSCSSHLDLRLTFSYEGEFKLTDEMKKYYDDNGFLVIKNFLDAEELTQLWKIFDEPDGILKHSYQTNESDNKKILRIMYKHPGNDVSGILSRSTKVVDSCEKLLEGEVYHYHGKFILKNPREGGAHVWHQDYGYWYKHNLFPDMITVWLPMDKATRQNSCLQLLKGSHKCGRIAHIPGGATLQTQADPERIEQLKSTCEHLYCEMEAGDVLFQHCNTLHTSSPNDSDMRRWAFVMCYNKASNDSFLPHHHANYRKIDKVPNSAIKECKNYTDFSGKEFINPMAKEEDRQHFPQTTAEQ